MIILKPSTTLKQVNYDCERPVIVVGETSPVAIRLAIEKNDEEAKRFVIRFSARIFTECERENP